MSAAFSAALLGVGTADTGLTALLRTVQVQSGSSGDAQKNDDQQYICQHSISFIRRCLKKKEICTGARDLCDRRRIFPQEYARISRENSEV